jgi:transglutaminase/protease-like cytokinesis protein 3
VPPEDVRQGREELNEQGRTVKVYERAKTEEELAEAKRLRAIQLEEEKKAEEQAKKDQVLLATYSSEADMLNTRDSKLASIEDLILLTEHRIESMQSRLTNLTDDAASYERSGKKVPDVITRQIENIRKQTSENEAFIVSKQEEQQAIREQFDRDIARFNELKVRKVKPRQ